MSLQPDGIWAASPATTRGLPTIISCDAKGERITYVSNKSAFVRSIDNPNESRQYTASSTLTVSRFAPSGAYIAVGDVNGIVRIWDCLGEGNLKNEYTVFSGPVNDIAWDGESARIIAVGNGKSNFGHCFSADGGNSVGEISGHSAQVNCVSIRQQRPLRAATGSDDLSLVFYHGAPFKFNTSSRGRHSRYLYGTAFSPDGTHLVSVGADRKICLYDGKTGEAKQDIGSAADGDEQHTGSVFGVAWSHDSKRIVTCSADQTVRVWDVESCKCVHTWRLGEQAKVDVSHHQVGVCWPRKDLVITVDLTGNINYLSFDKPDPTNIICGHQKSVTVACITDSNKCLWTGSYDGRILAWDVTKGLAELPEGQAHSSRVSGLAAAPSGRVYSTGWDDSLRTLDASQKSFVGDVAKTDGQPRGVSVAVADGKTITLVLVESGVVMYTDGKQVGTEKLKSVPTCTAATDSTVVIGCEDGNLCIYTATPTGLTLQKEHKLGSSAPSTLAFSSSSPPTLAVGTGNKIVAYSLSGRNGEDLTEITSRWSAHTGRVTCIAWSADGQHAASGGLDTHVYVWSLADPGKRVKALNAHKDGVAGVAWTDSTTLATTGADATVRRWKMEA